MSKPQKLVRTQDDETSEQDFSEQEVKFRGNQQPNRGKQNTQTQQQHEEKPKLSQGPPKRSNFIVRTIYTLLMLFGFFSIIASGPFYSVIFISMISILMFQELLRLKRIKEKESEIPWFHLVNWYFYCVSLYFCLGKLIQNKLPHLIIQNENIHFAMKYHNVIFFMLWAAGFVIFTLSLKPGYYKYQLRQFGWTHIGCFFILSSTGLMMQSTYEGMIWFLLPATLVISNDIFAYIFGFFFGTHKLIQLSPKKTWEGFIGGAFSSVLWAFLLSYFATFVRPLICPQRNLEFIPFVYQECQLPSHFELKTYTFPAFFNNIGLYNFYMSEFNQHAMIMSLFASLIAPFGGFFASGIKRALKIKDFGDVIPGHGGLIDRFDCQLIMGIFSYVYIHSIILSPSNILGGLLGFIDNLNIQEQVEVYNYLRESLLQKQLIN